MFAILRNAAMESSHARRLSPTILPTPLPASVESPPPPLIPYFKVEKEERESLAKIPKVESRKEVENANINSVAVKLEPRGIESDSQMTKGGAIKFEPRDDQTDSQMFKERLEMYWKGMMKYQRELQHEPVQAAASIEENEKDAAEMKTQGKDVQFVNWADIDTKHEPFGSSHKSHATLMENNGLVQQDDPLFSQQTLAAVIAMQTLQRQRQDYGVGLGNLLPPPPGLIGSTTVPCSTSNSSPLPPNSSTVVSQIPHTSSGKQTFFENSMSNHHSPTSQASLPTTTEQMPESLGPVSDMPLDLSLPAAGKKRSLNGVHKVVSRDSEVKNTQLQKDRKKVDDVSLASIKSNFPTLLNSNRAQARAAQQAMLTAHIESSLSTNPVSASTGPFTSFYQKHENCTPVVNSSAADIIQGEAQPSQIQQWLLAAVSAQKMQQVALNHISMLQRSVKYPDPPKKRLKLTRPPAQNFVSYPPLPQSSVNRQLPVQPTSEAPQGPSNFPLINRSTRKGASPAHSPDSNQSQSGKRYRRYAKPPYSYVSLITLSILSSREKKLRLSQILKRISEMFPFFNGSYQGWRDSVRHNLSQNECFVKVLKNPYRPTAKGNFWTVNLSSIPHELLLRQNTLVSRYAQDSGYRYRKDLSEVFDLRTGALKVAVPRHLLRDTTDLNGSALSDDPAAVMEAILLEETSDDEMSDYKEKISPDVRQFTLEDLFSQCEEGEDDSILSSGRSRGRNKQPSNALSKPPTLIPSSFVPSLYQPSKPTLTAGNGVQSSFHGRTVELPNFAAMGVLPQVLLSQVSSQATQFPMALSNNAPNPFAAAQTALLTKALAATQLHGFDNLQKMLHSQALQKPPVDAAASIAAPVKTPTPPLSSISPIPKMPNPSHAVKPCDADQSVLSDASTSSKKNKRKGIHPVRHTGNLEVDTSQNPAYDAPSSPRNFLPASGLGRTSSTPSRTASSEGDSASCNPFCSPIMSSTKSQSHPSPRHDESSECEDGRNPPHSVFGSQAANGMASFQSLQVFGSSSIQATKMA